MLRKIQSYEILERIGMGGMGIVYKARHSFRNEVVAIKSLSPQYCHDPQIRERFIHEAEILNKLNHPNIVKVVDFVQEVDELHLVMQFVEGKTLDKIIGTEVGPIPFEQALPLFKQILNGIAYAHKNGVIHRDLKPSNIIVHNGNVVITDFGIAKITGNAGFTKTGTKLGTLYYMSPEQIRGEHVTDQSDIYSLGMTLYEMLAGRLPYDKSSDTSEFNLMNQIVNQELPDPRKFYPAIPEWLVSIIKKAITKDKKDRIKNCQEFVELLKNEPKKIEVQDLDKRINYEEPLTKFKEPVKVNRDEEPSVEQSRVKQKIPIRTIIFIVCLITLIYFVLIKEKFQDQDENSFSSVKIGNQIWMAKNLNESSYRNGDVIPEARSNDDWIKANEEMKGVWCYYNNEPTNGKKYGKLYNWYAVVDRRGLAPEGWHIPTAEEFQILKTKVNNDGNTLKEISQGVDSDVGTNTSGFSTLMAGERFWENGRFYNLGDFTGYWSLTKKSNSSYVLELSSRDNRIDIFDYDMGYGYSVRCVKD